MTESLWNCTAEELLRRASSADPTPGGGSIAAVTAAFGFSLVQMAIGVTLASPPAAPEDGTRLIYARARARDLQAEAVAAVDRDVVEFEAVMSAYRMPHDTDGERESRRRAIDQATVIATHGPLGLAETAIAGLRLVGEIEPLIKRSIASDAQAGRDLLQGAALAALRTADINLATLEEHQHSEAPALRQRRHAASAGAAGAEDAGAGTAD